MRDFFMLDFFNCLLANNIDPLISFKQFNSIVSELFSFVKKSHLIYN